MTLFRPLQVQVTDTNHTAYLQPSRIFLSKRRPDSQPPGNRSPGSVGTRITIPLKPLNLKRRKTLPENPTDPRTIQETVPRHARGRIGDNGAGAATIMALALPALASCS